VPLNIAITSLAGTPMTREHTRRTSGGVSPIISSGIASCSAAGAGGAVCARIWVRRASWASSSLRARRVDSLPPNTQLERHMAATRAVEGGLTCLGYPRKSQQELRLALNRLYCEEVCGDLFEAEVELGY
jgi:hypothetical protein